MAPTLQHLHCPPVLDLPRDPKNTTDHQQTKQVEQQNVTVYTVFIPALRKIQTDRQT